MMTKTPHLNNVECSTNISMNNSAEHRHNSEQRRLLFKEERWRRLRPSDESKLLYSCLATLALWRPYFCVKIRIWIYRLITRKTIMKNIFWSCCHSKSRHQHRCAKPCTDLQVKFFFILTSIPGLKGTCLHTLLALGQAPALGKASPLSWLKSSDLKLRSFSASGL